MASRPSLSSHGNETALPLVEPKEGSFADIDAALALNSTFILPSRICSAPRLSRARSFLLLMWAVMDVGAFPSLAGNARNGRQLR